MGGEYKKFRFKHSELGFFNSSNCEKITSMIEKDHRVAGFTDGTFSLIDILYHILKKVGKSKVVIVTWSAGIKDANNVRWMMDNDLIEDIKIIIDMSFEKRKKSYAVEIDKLFGEENIRISRMHAKLILIENEYYNIVVNTSMNLNANKTIESFEITEDKTYFNFYKKFCDAHINDLDKGYKASFKSVNQIIKDFFFSYEKKENSNWYQL